MATNLQASPSIIARKLLGGVDQATLRQTLSSHGSSNMASSSEYLSDLEVWAMTDPLHNVESLQLDMANSEDIQVHTWCVCCGIDPLPVTKLVIRSSNFDG